MLFYDYIGIVATVINCLMLIPQIHLIIKDKDAKSISYITIFLAELQCFLWIIYASNIMSYQLITVNFIVLMENLIIFILKYSYGKKEYNKVIDNELNVNNLRMFG